MKANRLPHIELGYLLPLLLMVTMLGHHHSAKEANDHCELCATVGANRRRVGGTTPIQAQSAGGRPGESEAVATRSLKDGASEQQTTAVVVQFSAESPQSSSSGIQISVQDLCYSYGLKCHVSVVLSALAPRAPPISA